MKNRFSNAERNYYCTTKKLNRSFVKIPSYLSAFTLAEVLITVAVIGIIAALTIPPIINKSNEVQIVTGVKKAYANLYGGYTLLIADYSDMPSAINEHSSSVVNTIMSKMRIAKFCGYANDNDSGCFPNKNYKDLSGNDMVNFSTNDNYATFLGADAIAYAIYPFSTSCASNQGDGPLYNSCALIWADVDGPKHGPAVFGRDLFSFSYTLTGVFPTGSYYNNWFGFGADCATNGATCTAEIIKQGAINY